MPLVKSAKPKAVAQNIREMVKAGHPQKQAVAAAMQIADHAKHIASAKAAAKRRG